MDIAKPVFADYPHSGALSQALSGPRIAGLDFLRALAVFAVLLDHSGLQYSRFPYMLNGAMGVQLFFVLSGFLITWLLLGEFERHGRIDFKAFYIRRFARLMPIFYVYVLLGTAVLLIAGKQVPWGAVFSSLFYGLNYYQALTGGQAHFLSHCWSLAVEEQFYFLWPLALALMLRKGMRLDKALVALIAGVWVYRAGAQLLGLASDDYIYRALEMRADHLLIGCLLAVLLKQARCRAWFEQVHAKTPWVIFILLAILSISGTHNQNLDYRYALGYMIEPIVAALLLPLIVLSAHGNASPLARLCNAPLVLKVGQASYGIYLLHQLVLHPVSMRLNALTHSPVLTFAIIAVLLAVVAHLSYTYFEMPIRRRLHGRR